MALSNLVTDTRNTLGLNILHKAIYVMTLVGGKRPNWLQI